MQEILHIYLIDYIPFIILLWALFTVAGGILIRGSFNGTPVMNLVLLVVGTVGLLAPLIGHGGVIGLLAVMGLAGAALGMTLPATE